MPGSSRCIEIHMFAGLRVASTYFTPEYNKNGVNVSAKCDINAYRNIASMANQGKGRNEVTRYTTWGKLARVCALSMSPGKEFHAICDMHQYDGRVFQPSGTRGVPGTPVMKTDGTSLTTDKTSFTIRLLSFGEESTEWIMKEMNTMGPDKQPLRPTFWFVRGHADALRWSAILKSRQAVQFQPGQQVFGYANVRMPQGEGISAYNPALETQRGGAPIVQPPVGTVVQPQTIYQTPLVEAAVMNAAGNPQAINPAFQPPAGTVIQPAVIDPNVVLTPDPATLAATQPIQGAPVFMSGA